MKTPYRVDIEDLTRTNEDFRRVLFTGETSQLVIMTIPPGGEIGEERHDHVEQTLVCVSGSGESELEGIRSRFEAGDVVVVTPGTLHNFRNNGPGALRVFTIYSPPNHIDGRIHHTKADADADKADEAFGHGATLGDMSP
jgi:mannose-6-phosphate isomerase-like protein (cupin superfamily)